MGSKKWKYTEIEPEAMQALQLVFYHLTRDHETSYALFLQKMDIRGITGDCMFVCHPQEDGTFLLGVNFEHFNKLSKLAKAEILKHVVLHIPLGHKSARGRKLVDRYGPELAELAQDLVVDQLIGVDILATQGVNLPVPEHYGLKRGLTTDQYAELLEEMAQSGGAGGGFDPNGFNLPSPISCPGRGKNNPHGLPENQHGFTSMDPADSSDQKELAPKSLDNATKKMLDAVDDVLKSQGKRDGIKTQGFFPGECSEFIESLEREAKISWAALLRRKEGKHRRIFRKPTKRRPSRRNFNYWGRIKKKGVSCLVVVDTSGSMSKRELRCVDAEVKALVSRNVQVFVTYVDTRVAKEPFEYKRGMRLTDFTGRGGTDFRPAFKAYAEMPDQPDFMVYVTDGYGTAPAEDPGVDLLWVLTSNGMSEDAFRQRVCQYGEVAILDVDTDNYDDEE